MEAVLAHVDIDAFYASVEQRDEPRYRGKPVVVGALPGHRGVVSACSYEARRYGIRSAMPISEAYRRCPHAVYLPVRMRRYAGVSARIMDLLKAYSPVFQQISIDEACLDLTGTERLFGPPRQAGKKMRADVKDAVGLTISIGIAGNRFLAKLASEACKPDGLLVVEDHQRLTFLDTLSLKDLWGVGNRTLERLHALNITSIPGLRAFSLEMLRSMLGDAGGRYLFAAARGEDPGIRPTKPRSQSISSEHTFETDRKDAPSIRRMLLELCEQVSSRLIEEGKRSHTLGLKLRLHDFTTLNAQKTLRHWLGSAEEMYAVALELLGKRWDGRTPIRLLGIGVSGVESASEPTQLELFPDEDDRRKKIEEAVVKLRRKMNGVTLTRASLLQPPGRDAASSGDAHDD